MSGAHLKAGEKNSVRIQGTEQTTASQGSSSIRPGSPWPRHMTAPGFRRHHYGRWRGRRRRCSGQAGEFRFLLSASRLWHAQLQDYGLDDPLWVGCGAASDHGVATAGTGASRTGGAPGCVAARRILTRSVAVVVGTVGAEGVTMGQDCILATKLRRYTPG